MSQVIKIKRGGISGLSGLSSVQGELIIATGSLGNNVDGQFLLAHGDSLGLTAGAVFTGSSVPTITDSELNGILFYDSANSRFYRLDSSGNQALDIQATSFSGDTDGVSEGSTNLYYTDARVKTKLNSESVISGSKANVLTFLNVEDGADVTDTANVTAAGALMDSEVTDLAGIKSVTISTLQPKPSEGAFVDGDKTKLDGIETGADVTDATNVQSAGALMDSELAEIATVKALTAAGISGSFGAASASFSTRVTANDAKLTADTTNVTAAGALMDSEVTNLAAVKAFDPTDYATAAQGTTADNALPKAGGQMTGNITFSGAQTVDGRDLSADGTKLDGIETGADVTDAANVTTALGSISVTAHNDVTNAGSGIIISAAERTKLSGIETGADVTDTTNVKAALNANLGTLTLGDSDDTVSVPGNLSVGGTLTTVNSNEVNIGDRIVVLNTANGAGDAGIQVHDTSTNQTGSLLWDTTGDYWKGGEVGSEKRIVTFNADNPTNTGFVYTNASDEIVVAAGSTAGDILQWNGSAFAISNEIDGGTF